MAGKRVLFFANAVTLAHLARPLALIREAPSDWEIHLACPGNDYRRVLAGFPHPVHDLDALSPIQFRRALDWGLPIFTEARLRRDIDADLAIIDRVQPDLVIGDWRLSLSISARVAQVRYVNVCNAYWRPDFCPVPPMPDLVPLRPVPRRLAEPVFRRVIGRVFAAHARPFNRLRKRFGLAELGPDVRFFYTDGDLALYADAAEHYPELRLASHQHFLGPVLWSPPVADPPWWNRIPEGNPLIYLTVGSSGDHRAFAAVLRKLRELPVQVIAAVGGRESGVSGNCFYAPCLNGLKACHRAALMICNGGVMSCHQALAAGIPILGVCRNMDQLLNMKALGARAASQQHHSSALEKVIRTVAASALSVFFTDGGGKPASAGKSDGISLMLKEIK